VSARSTLSPAWAQAELVAALVAIDPWSIGGAVVKTRRGPVHDIWIDSLTTLMADRGPVVPVPVSTGAERLLGEIDVSATLAAGRMVEAQGLLARADQGALLIPNTGPFEPPFASALAGMLDRGEAPRAAGGLDGSVCARAGVVIIDEARDDDMSATHRALWDRLALRVDLTGLSHRDAIGILIQPEAVAEARALRDCVTVPVEIVEGLCGAALACAIASGRGERLALEVARSLAALAGRTIVTQEDATQAAQLVLLPRAEQLPEIEAEAADAEPDEIPSDTSSDPPRADDAIDATNEEAAEPQTDPSQSRAPEEVIVEALALDADLAALIAAPPASVARRAPPSSSDGRRPGVRIGRNRGKPIGVRRPRSLAQGRLNISATLRAAVPWQRLRRKPEPARDDPLGDVDARRIIVHPDDLRISRYREQEAQTIIFLVDASGSTALARLAETKGAVELLLSESYRRRDEVALVSFRGDGAEVLLPPTRSLVRAKRQLARLPGGGGTPLASGLLAGLEIGIQVEASGRRPVFVVMSDGRPNIDLTGQAHRAQALDDALKAARLVEARGWSCLFLDVAVRRSGRGEELARKLGARYAFLPRPTSRAVADNVTGALLSGASEP
jgi:magnesium chelatase subunit D